ncbi:MAG: amidohydrolase family protein [Planctomycetota bacterium]
MCSTSGGVDDENRHANAGVSASGRPAHSLVDSHVHLVDFLQDSDGVHALLEQMDDANIARAVVFGLPVVKKWNAFEPREPRYYLDDNAKCYYYSYTDQLVIAAYESLAPEQRARVAPLICGFNPTDMHGIRHVERMFRESPHWRGVGEVLLRHDDLTNLTLDETARANHPAMRPIYEFCELHQLPIVLHQNSSSVGCDRDYVYLHELEEVLGRHDKLTVVWAHCGLSRRVRHDNYHEMIERMLNAYPRLHVDVSWVGYDDVMCLGGSIRSEWLGVIERFADRVLLGSDLVGHFAALGPTMRRFDDLLAGLTEAARPKVARSNAERLFFEPART